MSKPENPPAFPRPDSHSDTHYTGPAQDGMSLRDWFAGQALAHLRIGDWSKCEDGARYCYDYADAMLAERMKTRAE